MDLWRNEAGKCGPIRQIVLQQLLYKGSWRDLVLCQTGTTGSFLYNAVMFLEQVQMAFNVGALNHVNYQLYSYDLPLKSDWINNRAPMSLLRPFFWVGWLSWFIQSFVSLSPCLGSWAFVLTFADVFAKAVIHFKKPDHSLLKACLFGKLDLWLSKACSLLGMRFFECSSFTCCFLAVGMHGHAEKSSMSLPL